MISSARIFGAPVTDPGGKVARTTSAAETPARSRASTRRDEVVHARVRLERAQLRDRDGAVSARRGRGRCARGRRSSRSRRRSFALERSASARRRSAAASAARGRVPLIGRVSIASPRRRRNRSGEAEITSAPPSRTSAANGAGLVAPQARVERERIAVPRRAEALREVDLEDVAGADVVDRAPHGALVVGARQRAAPLADRRSCAGCGVAGARAARARGARASPSPRIAPCAAAWSNSSQAS